MMLETPQNRAFENTTFKKYLEAELRTAFVSNGIPEHLSTVVPTKPKQKADFQCNSIIGFAKKNGKNPFELAASVAECFRKENFYNATVSRPGFLNFTFSDDALVSKANILSKTSWYFMDLANPEQTIILDYGGPNIAKEMHVGHLRSAIIGQSLAEVFRFAGFNVVTDVHLGDWGLQMGLIIAQLKEESKKNDAPLKVESISFEELHRIYPLAAKRAKEDLGFLELARQETASLQSGAEEQSKIWQQIVSESMKAIKRDYFRLGVDFDCWYGESRYQGQLQKLSEQLVDQGVAIGSQGALVISFDDMGMPPLILQNSNGSFGYGATDLATLLERVQKYHPSRIIYVVDIRQSLHFKQLFFAGEKVKLSGRVKLEHASFGTINGKDGKPFKTRDGGTMRLWHFMETMKDKATERLIQSGDMDEELVATIAEAIGISAIKYGELSHDRETDYIFDMDKFLQFEGNTGPYLQYTSVRIASLLAKASQQNIPKLKLTSLGPSGREIVLRLDAFSSVIDKVINSCKPSFLASHLFLLAGAINTFYHDNRVLSKSTDKVAAESHLYLLSASKTQLDLGLRLLGISVPEKM